MFIVKQKDRPEWKYVVYSVSKKGIVTQFLLWNDNSKCWMWAEASLFVPADEPNESQVQKL